MYDFLKAIWETCRLWVTKKIIEFREILRKKSFHLVDESDLKKEDSIPFDSNYEKIEKDYNSSDSSDSDSYIEMECEGFQSISFSHRKEEKRKKVIFSNDEEYFFIN